MRTCLGSLIRMWKINLTVSSIEALEVIIQTLYPLPTLYPSSEDEEKENNRALMTVSGLQSHLVAEPGKIAQFLPLVRDIIPSFSPHVGDTEGARSGAKDVKTQNNPVHSCRIARNSEYCITLT